MMSAQPVITVDEWNCDYGSGDLLKEPLSASLHPGMIYVVRGSIACGKTSLLKSMAGLLPKRYQRGGVFYHHDNVRVPIRHPRKSAETARWVGYLPQNVDAGLLFSKVADELLFALESAPRTSRIELSEVDVRLRGFPIQHLVSRETTVLSRGEKQAVALAACVLKQPAILLLDEPFSALDARVQQQAADLIRHSMQLIPGMSVVFSCHEESVLKLMADAVPLDVPWANNYRETHRVVVGPREPPPRKVFTGPVLAIKDLTIRAAEQHLVTIPELTVNAREVVALFGENGSGKSTVAFAIAGMRGGRMREVKVDGEIRLMGELAVDHRLRCPGLVTIAFQDPELRELSGSVERDLEKGVRTGGGQVGVFVDASAQTAFSALLDLLAKSDPGRRVDQLSHAQQKALGLACLGTYSRLLVVDDPPTSIEESEASAFVHWIESVADSGTGVLLLVHDMSPWSKVVAATYHIQGCIAKRV